MRELSVLSEMRRGESDATRPGIDPAAKGHQINRVSFTACLRRAVRAGPQ